MVRCSKDYKEIKEIKIWWRLNGHTGKVNRGEGEEGWLGQR